MVVEDSVLLVDAESEFWPGCLSALKMLISETAVKMWFSNIRFEGFAPDGSVMLVANNELSAGWVDAHYRDALLETFRNSTPSAQNYVIRVPKDSTASPVPVFRPVPAVPMTKNAVKISAEDDGIARESLATLASFYSSYSFENFVEGDCNCTALNVSRTVAANPGENRMNPLVLYGGTGVGKTHLLQSIGRYAITYKTAQRVVYRTAERFLKDFIHMVRAPRGERVSAEQDFRRVYDSADLLLIDDVQVLAGKLATEDELFKILVNLMKQKKQIVLCCDRRPCEVPDLSERLLSRFDCGLSASLEAPDLVTRIGILRHKAASLNIPKEEQEKVFHWLALRKAGNVREIEGVITKLLAYHELMGLNFNLDTVRHLLGDSEGESRIGCAHGEAAPQVTIRAVIDATADAFDVNPTVLSSHSRIQAVSLPRKVAMYLCRELTHESLKTIGFQFNRDYATVIASEKSIERLIETDPALASKIDAIRGVFCT